MAESSIPAARAAARARRRRMIFNNDGCDCFKRPNAAGSMAADLLEVRTAPLADSYVDTIFYNTNRGGVGTFSHRTQVGQYFTRRDGRYAANICPALAAADTDPLAVMLDWGRRENVEVFWSLRMNDTHDGWGTPGEFPDDYFGPAEIKRRHPEWLLGGKDRKPKFGLWTALNYEVEPVRDFMFRIIEEVCRNYDVAGVECDFMRHPTFFPATAAGQDCGDRERACVTGLLRRVRKMLDELEAERGKPLLVAARVPDSLAVAAGIGLDVEAWMGEGLVDLLSVSDYYRFGPWAEPVAAGRRHDVPVFACLAESRVKLADGQRQRLRNTLESMRGRALNAWQEGVAGLYMFNFFNPHSAFWREGGDPNLLANRDRIYFASVRSLGGANWRIPGAHRHRTIPGLAPGLAGSQIPLRLETTDVAIDAGGSLAAAREIELRMQVAKLADASGVAARWNGRWLEPGRLEDGVLRWRLPPEQVQPQGNLAGLVLTGPTGPVWEDLQLWVAVEGSIAAMERNLTDLDVG
jgi:hypothetical protein